MAVNYGKIVRNSLNFCIRPGRWLPFFLADLAFFSVLVVLFLYNSPSMIQLLTAMGTDPTAALSLFGLGLTVMAAAVVYALVKLWLSGAVIHQSFKERDNPWKSFRISYKRYLSLFAAAVVIMAVNMAAGTMEFLPYAGVWLVLILRIALYFVFFLVYQGIIVDKMDFWKAIRNSYSICIRKFIPLLVTVVFILVISILILGVFAIPIVGALFGIISQNVSQFPGQQAGPEFLAAVINSLIDNLPMLLIGGLIFLVGSSISQVFTLKAQTEFYLQVRKKRFGFR
jgi:hypothetical protein